MSVDDNTEESLSEDNTPPKQMMLVQSLITIPIKWDFEEEWQGHNIDTAAIISYCDFEEGGPLGGWLKLKGHLSDNARLSSVEAKPIEKAEDEEQTLKKKHKLEQEPSQTAKNLGFAFNAARSTVSIRVFSDTSDQCIGTIEDANSAPMG